MTAAFASAGRPVFKGEPPTHVLLGPIQEARGPDRSREASIALWVGAMAVIVLLIACANVTNLLLARGVSRRRDIGIRLAVGARPYRIARMLVLEAVVLAGLGAIAAMLLALWGAPVVQAYFLPNATGSSVLDLRGVLTMSGVALCAALLSVSVPAWRATRPSLAMSLTSGPRETGGQRWRGIRGLLAVQTALAVVLLVGAGLFVQSVRHLEGLDLGLQPDRVLGVTLDARGARISQDQIPALYARLADVTRGLGGVQSVSLSMGSPFHFSFGGSLTLQDRPTPREFPGGGPYQYAVTPDYFSTMGMTIVQGRGFTPEDRAGSAKVIVLNQTLASAFWPNQDPLGRCVVIGDDRTCATVVGIAKDTPRWTVLELHGALYYVPLSQLNGASPTALYVRTRGQPDAMIAAVRRAVVGAAPNLPYIDIEPLESSVAPQLKPWRLGKTMFTMYGALALLLTALGLYGVLAYMVGRRTQEIGVRMALGAGAGRVRRMVLRDGMVVVGLGILAGAAVAIIGGRFIAAQLFQESPRDPAVLGAAGAALLLAAIAACWVPARRATRVNPVDALRAE
ncbi:MAG TPA: FtsX-like permease family protein [Gemmatimonadales bacterium]|nr:FtsX-like permease family protein [Gemmatimonadales bacterium]